MDRSTLKRRLVEAGHTITGEHQKWTTLEIHRAILGVGDMEAAKYRETAARAALLEIDIRKAERELIPIDDAVSLINRKLAPVRQQLLSMPSILGPKANPSDPTLGIEACTVWRDGCLRFVHDVPLDEAKAEEDNENPTRKRIRGTGGKGTK